jgi:hypothetical protein
MAKLVILYLNEGAGAADSVPTHQGVPLPAYPETATFVPSLVRAGNSLSNAVGALSVWRDVNVAENLANSSKTPASFKLGLEPLPTNNARVLQSCGHSNVYFSVRKYDRTGKATHAWQLF